MRRERRPLRVTEESRSRCAWPRAIWRLAKWWTARRSPPRCGWPICFPTAVTEPSGIVGQRLGSAVIKGEVLSVRRTEAQEADISVPQGLAAISVPARAVQAVGGSVEAGMHVDVYATGPVSTTRLVEGALVLASSASAETGSAAASNAWITLAVAPERVQEIVSAAQNLELYFALPATTGSESGGAEAALDGAVEVPADGGAVPSDAPASEQEAAAIETPPAEESAPSEAPSAEGAVL